MNRVSMPCRILCPAVLCALALLATVGSGSAATYYVSSSAGSDSNSGTSPGAPFKTVTKVNGLALAAGDNVLFLCGDTWRADILRVTRSGAAGSPITYGSYPDAACANKPMLAGTQPIAGWAVYSGSIWMADLSAGANAGLFPNGINQLFRDGSRLRLGRWPNVDSGDGYSTIDSQSGAQITDAQLPAVDWTGATAHIRGMRWYILNRQVTADSGNTLTLNSAPGCWDGSCAGWGFFLNGHLATLDQEGEWYYNATSRRVYLYSATNPGSSTIEGSVVISGESEFMGGIILGRHLYEHVNYVTIDNFEIRGWFDNGVTTPVNLEKNEHSYVNLRHLTIRDVDGSGINLATWVWNASANGNGYDGWRGGRNIEISDSLIERANEYGINSYARSSLITRNTIRDIAQIGNVGVAGIGCTLTDGEGLCTEPGTGIRLKGDSDGAYSSNAVTVELNRLERIGGTGLGVYGYSDTIRRNLIQYACTTKGDCGGVSLFGGPDLGSTTVHDVTIEENIILDTIGNTDGASTTYRPLFGFGLYIDNYSRSISSLRNTVARSTSAGILYQNSSGTIQGNTLLDNSNGTMWAQQIVLTTGSSTSLTSLTDNVMVGLLANAGTLSVRDAAQVGTSDRNGFYHANRARHIYVSALGQDRNLSEWRSYSGKDASSRERVASAISLARLYYNDQTTSQSIPLVGVWYDLDANLVTSPITLAPFASRILVESELPALSVADVSIAEGSSGSGQLTFAVKLSKSSTQTVSVGYATADGSATAGSDYTSRSGTLSFAPGVTELPVTVSIVGDTAFEGDETLELRLSAPVNAVLADGTAIGTILNDDAASRLLTVVRNGPGSGTVSSAPDGIACGADCAESYAPGTIVTLTVTAGAGSVFAGWGSPCSGWTPTCAVELTADTVVTATFRRTLAPERLRIR